MKPVEFPEQTVIAGEHQDEYLNLPALTKMDEQGEVVSCWQLSPEDQAALKTNGGKIWLSVFTFHKGLPPVMLTTDRETALHMEEPAQERKANRCDTCSKEMGACGQNKILFGRDLDPRAKGVEVDRVVECDGYTKQETTTEETTGSEGN